MRYLKYSIQTGIVNILSMFMGIASSVITARWLGPEGVGIYAMLLLVQSFAFRFGNLGFGSAFAFYVAKYKICTSRILQIVWMTGSILSLFAGTFLLVIWHYDISPWKDIPPPLFYLSLITIPLVFFKSYLQRVLSGELRITAINISNTIRHAWYVLLLVLLVIILELDIQGAMLSTLGSELVSFLYILLQFRKRRDQIPKTKESGGKLALIYTLWHYGRWNYLLLFANYFFEQLPLFLLKIFSNNNAFIGFFSKAKRLFNLFVNISIKPLSQMLFPFTAASKKQKAILRTNLLCRSFILIMVLMLMPMLLCIKPLVLLLYGADFLPVVKIFYAFVPGILILPLGKFLGVHVAASGQSRDVFLVSLITLVVGSMFCFILISSYGMVGSGLSLSLFYLIWSILRLIAYIRMTGTSLSDVLLPNKADWGYYQNVLKILALRFLQKVNALKT